MRILLEKGNVVKVANTKEQAAKLTARGFTVTDVHNGNTGSDVPDKVPEGLPPECESSEEPQPEASQLADEPPKEVTQEGSQPDGVPSPEPPKAPTATKGRKSQ